MTSRQEAALLLAHLVVAGVVLLNGRCILSEHAIQDAAISASHYRGARPFGHDSLVASGSRRHSSRTSLASRGQRAVGNQATSSAKPSGANGTI